MKECIEKLIALGKIPDDDDMSDDLFRTYDALIQKAAPLTYEEAEQLILLFSDDCPDLNDGLMRVIETVDLSEPNTVSIWKPDSGTTCRSNKQKP